MKKTDGKMEEMPIVVALTPIDDVRLSRDDVRLGTAEEMEMPIKEGIKIMSKYFFYCCPFIL